MAKSKEEKKTSLWSRIVSKLTKKQKPEVEPMAAPSVPPPPGGRP